METGLKELEAKKVALPRLLDRLHLACLTFQHEPKGQMRSKTNITGQKILASFKIFYQEKYFIHEISDEIKSYTGKKSYSEHLRLVLIFHKDQNGSLVMRIRLYFYFDG